MRFPLYSYVRHIKSGGVYQILDLPSDNRLESTGEPAYGYRDIKGSGPKWQRSQTEMEDGRFERWNVMTGAPIVEDRASI